MKPYAGEKKKHSRIFEIVIVQSWWVVLFFLISYFAFDQSMKRKEIEKNILLKKMESLLEMKTRIEEEQEELKWAIASQDDPAWIEMTLMRCLGLVPEGETKIHFVEN